MDVVFSLFAADSVTLVGSGIAKGVTVGGGDVNVTASAVISVANPELWSVQRPYQYILSAAVQSAGSLACCGGVLVEERVLHVVC